MNARILLLGFVVVGCGSPVIPEPMGPSCSAATCNGCCDANDVCQPGVTKDACGVSGGACSSCDYQCSASVCIAKADPEPFPTGAKFVFTTSLGLQGDFGGRARANEHCNNLAQAAGLEGTFAAWLSGRTSTNGVIEHAKDFVTGSGPWFLTCRDEHNKVQRAFANRAALLTAPSTALDCDEKGKEIVTSVWTGTDVGGTAANFAQCANYSVNSGNSASWLYLSDYGTTVGVYDVTGSTGNSFELGEKWTSAGGRYCKDRQSFYCFQL